MPTLTDAQRLKVVYAATVLRLNDLAEGVFANAEGDLPIKALLAMAADARRCSAMEASPELFNDAVDQALARPLPAPSVN